MRSDAGVPNDAVRVLVVEDDPDVAEVLSEVLGWRGYETRLAHDAPTALRMAQEFRPAIAFVDIGLPVIDGYELAAQLRRLPMLSGVRLIALTGYSAPSDRAKSLEAGFDYHVVKPIGIEALD